MGVMNLPSNTLNELLSYFGTKYPNITLKPAEHSRWDAQTQTIFYDPDHGPHPIWSLLHEIGHMRSGHASYKSDIDLVLMESEAWKLARSEGEETGHIIDEAYIEDCIDSYRDWLHRRSTCPKCAQTGIEKSRGHYKCINCPEAWQVTNSRFCRVYRKTKTPR
jgi:hypothetical protein